jgi:hypothetical protein
MKKLAWAVGILILFTALFTVVLAQSGQFELPWHSIDGGGGTSTGGEFALQAAIGQPEAGSLSGGDFTLGGGFLVHPVLPGGELATVFLPLVLKPA